MLFQHRIYLLTTKQQKNKTILLFLCANCIVYEFFKAKFFLYFTSLLYFLEGYLYCYTFLSSFFLKVALYFNYGSGWGEKLKFFMGSVLMRVKNCLSADFFYIFTGSCEFFFHSVRSCYAYYINLTIKASTTLLHRQYILLNDDENHFFIVISNVFLRNFLMLRV